jgi:hypothetical protein
MFEEMTISLHYSRGGQRVSPHAKRACCARPLLLAAVGGLTALSAFAQYPGQITKKDDKGAPALRAVGVLEWTGPAGKPKTSRLVPVSVFDGEQLQDGGIYLARPEPLAVQGGVEYILQKDGSRIGLFDIESAGQEQGSWIGFGRWKAMPSPKPAAPLATAKVDEEESDKPTLHRKRGSSTSDSSDSGAPAAPPDPDRPTLHKKTDDSSSDGANGSSGASQSSSQGSGTSTGSSTVSAADPDRPTLKKGKPQAQEGYVESLPTATDPNRPKLERGKSDGNVGPEVTPTLVGLPEDMKQTVAVSDPRNKPEHPWGYSWADPADELKMKAAMEDLARTALGLNAPASSAPKAKAGTASTRAKRAPAPVEPAPLAGEVFRVFELAYGSGATLVLTAHTDAPPEKQKFVTLIGQPDLYGNALVLFKSVTDAAHLDDTPKMRLIDAVDAMADNRGELLFELRGTTQRQFALYRVMRGTAEKLFVSGGNTIDSEAKN